MPPRASRAGPTMRTRKASPSDILSPSSNRFCRNADHGLTGIHIRKNNRAGTYLGTIANRDIPKKDRSSSYDHTVSDYGSFGPSVLFDPDRHILEDHAVIPYDGVVGDDHAHAVVLNNASLSDCRPTTYVACEQELVQMPQERGSHPCDNPFSMQSVRCTVNSVAATHDLPQSARMSAIRLHAYPSP